MRGESDEMSVIIQNRGKNLFTKADFIIRFATGENYWFEGTKLYVTKIQVAGYVIRANPNTTYTISGTWKFTAGSSNQKFLVDEYPVKILTPMNEFIPLRIAQHVDSDDDGIISFTTSPMARYLYIGVYAATGYQAWFDTNTIQLEEGSTATEYEPPRNNYIEFNSELFGYAGVFDELRDDGTLIKRWNRESITITSGAGTVTKNGTGTCILVADSDGVPYDGTVSGTSISTSAPDGTYTIIYQLATPEIIDLNYDGELILHPGENNLILPDFAVASVSGARKYLEG